MLSLPDSWLKSLRENKFKQILRTGQSWTKGYRQIYKIKQNRFFYGMFYS